MKISILITIYRVKQNKKKISLNKYGDNLKR